MIPTTNTCAELEPLLQVEQTRRAKFCAVMAVEDPALNLVNDAIIPLFGGPASYEYPSHVLDPFRDVINEYSNLFHTVSGSTTLAYHQIPTQGYPVCIPPRRILVHYKATIEQQIHQMLEQGIIEESSSPWMAPAVFVPGEIHLCVDYRELNKRTVKDAYPLPLVDEM